MGPRELTKGNTLLELTRQNEQCTVSQGKHLGVTVWFRKFVCFFIKRHHTAKTAWRWVPRGPSTIFLATSFTRKMPESSDFMYSSFLMLENIWYHHFT